MRKLNLRRVESTASRGVAGATLASFFLMVFFGVVVVHTPAAAGVAISDKLSVFGDVRVRYEQDREDRTGTNTDRDRDRARFRARFGFKHKTTDKITMGMRFATAANSLQSPHQDLEVNGTNKQLFGIDQAYIETKWGKGGFLWLGKHGISFWEQNEQFWDGDIQPEGAGVGYKLGLSDDASLLLQSTFTLINEEGWSNSDNGVGEDDSAYTLQAVLTKGGGTAAIGRMSVQDDNDADLPGGSANYYIASVQYKTKTDLPIKLGVDLLWSDDNFRNGATADVTGVANGDEDQGYVLNASTKKGDWGFQVKHYDIELNSVPLQGLVSQDNFRFSSNFEGQRYQVGYNLGDGVKADFRIYDQDIKRTDLANTANAGWVQASEDNTRYQINLNAKF